ncbi:p-hydroxybenzoic acid efflux pump subunit AaeB [Rouxiella silvae]|uniref:p-hydroxybenzoic acid efflux pump subunit AaeB n=1 Tax=Rouxiella silvae TaxID=1646373 RepID=A0AA40X6I3_9GAMM|nr:p-hydroxybenzoic acid efflux pump subunit AaeB [Rouxiella silvae]MBF6639415.1 p-hydroxybenzoic acid efflux pump subunit AaeB [Rouxiella silvae]ORJ21108.1 p-hydroxybenzoic acid efflux pump subunit AaeB [Rouxiella silvae]
MNSQTLLRMRFACKLTFAILGALVFGFYLQLETPRWSAMTAAIVAAGPALVAGGEPFAGAIRHRGILRVIGTFIGCIAAIAIIMTFARAPALMLLVCCLWAGFCTWWSTVVRVENSYAFGLAGYTALIIVVLSSSNVVEAPQFAVERCSEIVVGICAAIFADLIFSPRSIKKDIDRAVDQLMLDQFMLIKLSVNQAEKEEMDKAWNTLVKSSTAINAMRGSLMMESSRWQRVNRRLKALHSISLGMITQACETYIIMQTTPELVPEGIKQRVNEPVENLQDVRKRMKQLRQIAATIPTDTIALPLYSWIGSGSRALLMIKGIHTNSSISSTENNVLSGEVVVKPASAEMHHAMINGLRTFVSSAIGCLLWLWTGWTSGAGCIVIIAVITSLAMRTPNPRMMAVDFMVGMLAAIPIGSLFYMVILPWTQQSLFLLCLSLGIFIFVIGIEVQKRRLGVLGLLVGCINILVLSNPMTFDVTSFLDNATGQAIGCVIALVVLSLIRDKSRDKTGRTLLNRFVSSAVSALTTKAYRRRENHLPALYHQLNQLLVLFPNDIGKYRLALQLIIAHQRLKMAEVPVNEELSAFHKQIRHTADRVVSSQREGKREYYYQRLLKEMGEYQQKLVEYDAPPKVTEPVRRLCNLLHNYQRAFLQ